MSLRINLNTAALSAHRMLSESDGSMGKTIERLSSGLKINSAADDPAGLVISEKLRAQVSGLGQAIRNAGDAVNMVRTAEAALNEVSRILRSMRDLALHAANTGATDMAAIQADQAQVDNAVQSINKIAEETQFGNKKLLDGTAGVVASVSGTSVVSGDFSNPAVTFSDNDAIHIDVTQPAEKATVDMADFGTSGQPVTQSGTFFINGVSFSYESGADTAQSIMSKINAKSADTGVTATIITDGQIKLESTSYGADAKISATSANSYILGATSKEDTGQDVQAAVTVNGTTAVSDSTWTAGDGLILKDSRGNQIVLTEAAATSVQNLNEQFRITLGTLKFQVGAYANQTRELNLRSVKAEMLGTGAIAGESLATLDLANNAQGAIQILDEAIREISSLRATLGATQKNVFESSIASLTVAKENIAASESTIRDTDMAEEVVNLTRSQILQQSGVSMLAQANQTPQTLLKLLQ